MSIDSIITLAIGIAAAIYVGVMMRRSARKLLGASQGNSSSGGCGSCSGCGTAEGHAESEESCNVRNSLVVIGEKSP